MDHVIKSTTTPALRMQAKPYKVFAQEAFKIGGCVLAPATTNIAVLQPDKDGPSNGFEVRGNFCTTFPSLNFF